MMADHVYLRGKTQLNMCIGRVRDNAKQGLVLILHLGLGSWYEVFKLNQLQEQSKAIPENAWHSVRETIQGD